jgi:hypothetical protein
VTRNLRDGAHGEAAEGHEGYADDPFVADGRNLDNRAVVQRRDQ